MISLLISILFVGLIVWLLLWLVDYVGIIPEPFSKVLKIVIVVLAVIWLVSRLLPFVEGGKFLS